MGTGFLEKFRRQFPIWKISLGLIIVLDVCFRLYQYRQRLLWSLEQSFTFWNIERIFELNKFSLIGTHFFSLTDGAFYRAPFGDWFFGILAKTIGLKLSTLFFPLVAASILSVIFCFRAARGIISTKAGLIASLLWAISWFVSRQEVQFWYATLIIPISATTLGLLFGMNWKSSSKELFLLGVVLGLGFSFHFVILWFIAGTVTFLISQAPGKTPRIIFSISCGLLLMALPLVVFNFRHGQIMNTGLKNMLTGQAIGDNATITDRVRVSYNTLNCLIGQISNLPCTNGLPLVVLGVTLLAVARTSSERTNRYLSFFLIQAVICFLGVFYAGRLGYGSQHYMLYMMPLVLVLAAIFIERILRSKSKLLLVLVLILYAAANFTEFKRYKDVNSYTAKESLAKYLYTLSQPKLTVKFVDEEVLAYSAVFFLTAQEHGLPFYKISMVEKWAPDVPDFYVFTSPIMPVKGKVIKFGDTKLLIPNKIQ